MKKYMYQLRNGFKSITEWFQQPEVKAAINATVDNTADTADKITVDAGDDGLTGGTLQEVLQDIYTKIDSIENA